VNLPQFVFAFSPRRNPKVPATRKWGIQNGANISQVFLEASKFFAYKRATGDSWAEMWIKSSQRFCIRLRKESSLPLRDKSPDRSNRANISYCKLALTNFFDLSNIRAFAGGPVKMFGASRCLQKVLFQFEGHPALRADLPFSCDFSARFIIQAKSSLQARGARLFIGASSAELCSLSALSQNTEAKL